jgi:hypothetical protein
MLPRKTDDIDVLNDAGEEGWELIAITANNIALLEASARSTRPAQETTSPTRTTRRKAPTSAK